MNPKSQGWVPVRGSTLPRWDPESPDTCRVDRDVDTPLYPTSVREGRETGGRSMRGAPWVHKGDLRRELEVRIYLRLKVTS